MTKSEVTKKYKYAGFWIRFFAVFVDGIILAAIGYVFFGSEITYFRDGSFGFSYKGWKILVPVLYTYISWICFSATPGKLVFHLKLINEPDGSNISFKQAFFRLISYPLSAFFAIGFIWAGFDSKKQTWHDKLAKTCVIKTN